jgi:N utilization substance protein B
MRVVQALYQWQVSGGDLIQIEKQFLNQKKGKISKAFFSNLFINIPKNTELLDSLIQPFLEKKIDELGQVERSILYLGAYELNFQPEVPYRVVINEAVGLAKTFAAEGAYRLINTILDRLATKLRVVEVKTR